MSPPDAENLWAILLERVRLEGKSYALSWLVRLRPLRVSDTALILGVQDKFLRDWVDEHFGSYLLEKLGECSSPLSTIEYEVLEGEQSNIASGPTPTVNTPAPVGLPGMRPHRLNERFTFANYVVADSNQLPAAAAAAVGENPGKCYNPLFIYGGSGLGKTHLLHAVGNKILTHNPGARIVYLTSEEFTNEYVESVRDQRMPEFRRKFRDECDVLLIDDIQTLGRKEETQKEFFYTFNTLHEMSKAIVLTSDTVPAEIPGLEDRLRSRFNMGLITDIQEPNFETRVAILKKKSNQEGIDISDEVCHFIARHVQKNVRELEGALVKLSAVHSLTHQPITVEFAAQVLKDLLPHNRPVDMEQIQREVARYYKVAVEDLRQDRRMKQLAHARQVAMYLCRTLTKSSYPEIGTRFNKDHSTVISACRKVERLLASDPQVKKELGELRAKLGV